MTELLPVYLLFTTIASYTELSSSSELGNKEQFCRRESGSNELDDDTSDAFSKRPS